MKTKFMIGLVMLFALSTNWVFGQDSWKIDSIQIVFHISNAGFDVEGTISGISGNLKFSKNKLDKSFFATEAKAGTIQTGIKLRDKHIKKQDYFDVERYPNIKIESKKIMKSKDGFESVCAITIKEQTKEIVIPFTFIQTNKKAEFKGSCSLNRLDFGLGEKSMVLSETVKIDFWISASLVTN